MTFIVAVCGLLLALFVSAILEGGDGHAEDDPPGTPGWPV